MTNGIRGCNHKNPECGECDNIILQARYLEVVLDSSNTYIFLLNPPSNHVIIPQLSLLNI